MTQHLHVLLHEGTLRIQQAWTRAVPTDCLRACEFIAEKSLLKMWFKTTVLSFPPLYPFPSGPQSPWPCPHALMSSPNHGTW